MPVGVFGKLACENFPFPLAMAGLLYRPEFDSGIIFEKRSWGEKMTAG